MLQKYGLGRGRTDLFLQWPLTEQGLTGPMQQVVLELKNKVYRQTHTHGGRVVEVWGM